MIFERYDVVRVPFPFSDREATKNRPALVLSSRAMFNHKTGHSVLAMITSAKTGPWALDCPIADLEDAGLRVPSVVRFKLFTLDHRLIRATLGRLSARDQSTVHNRVRGLFGTLE